MTIDKEIKKKADDIRNKIYGKEVRESLASGLEVMSKDTVDIKGRQKTVEQQFKVVIDETTEKDIISAPEILASRSGEKDLATRLEKDNIAEQKRREDEFVNIKEYGAVGDGETDDYPIIQEAIDNLNTDEVLFFPKGEYRISKGLVLQGDKRLRGSRARIIYNGNDAIIDIPNGEIYNKPEITGLVLYNDSPLKTGIGINIQKSISSFVIADCHLSGFNVAINHSQDVGQESYLTTIRNCEIRENNIGIMFNKDSNICSVTENNFRYNTTNAIVVEKSHKVTIDRNLFEWNASENDSHTVHIKNSYTTTVSNNYFEANATSSPTTSNVLVDGRGRSALIVNNFFNGKGTHSIIRITEDIVGLVITGNNFHEDGKPLQSDIIIEGKKSSNDMLISGNKDSGAPVPLDIDGIFSMSSVIAHGGKEYKWQQTLTGTAPRINFNDTATNKKMMLNSSYNVMTLYNDTDEKIALFNGNEKYATLTLETKGTSYRPTPLNKGHIMIDSELKKLIWWDGTVWRDAMGTEV